jgi:hypothetical protein
MKVALIAPTSLLEGTKSLTNYHLMLPHLLSTDSTYYAHFKELCKDPNQYVILDNGIAESIYISDDDLLDIVEDMLPNELVLPDQIENAQETIFNSMEMLLNKRISGLLNNGLRTMFVIQGSSPDNAYRCHSWAVCHPFINTLGIPRWMPSNWELPYIRASIANTITMELTALHANKNIHFLGGNTLCPKEIDVLSNPVTTNQKFIRGMDTSLPYVFSAHHALVNSGGQKLNRPDNYFDLKSEELKFVDVNLNDFLSWNNQ